MTLKDLHNELSQYLYINDFNLVDMLIASVIANVRKIGDPVWLTLIGASSAGKSQYIRPIAKSNPALFLRVDDLTSNTLISGNGESQSMIFRIPKDGVGIITIDDLTVLSSKNAEDRNAILAQFRMIYDGQMAKGTGKGQIITWTGHAGLIAGSTPSIYRMFADVADMGERFISYRMKDMDTDIAMKFIDEHRYSSKELDVKLTEIYSRFFQEMLPNIPNIRIPVDPHTTERIRNAAIAATKLRTPVIVDEREHFVSEFVVPEMPFRVYKQLMYLAEAYMIMHYMDTKETVLPNHLIEGIEWCAYSIADDKRRAYFRAVLALKAKGVEVTARNISAYTGLHHTAVERGMSVLSAIGVVKMHLAGEEGRSERRTWDVADDRLKEIVKRIDTPKDIAKEDYEDDTSL